VLGAASENARANESQKLLNWGYTAFEAVKLFDAGQPVATPAGLEGHVRQPQARAAAGHRGGGAGRQRGARFKTQVVRPDPLVAPFAKGQGVGSLKVLAQWPAAARRAPGRAGRRRAGRVCWGVPGMACGCGSSNPVQAFTDFWSIEALRDFPHKAILEGFPAFGAGKVRVGPAQTGGEHFLNV
jgi:hypothetical protein